MEEMDEQEYLNHTQNPLLQTELAMLIMTILGDASSEVWINAKTTTATSIQAKINQQKAEHFPESRPWDHKIELKEGFQPKSFKTYNLTPEEQKELDNWIKENLDKGYIRLSQSPMASPFFYVKKKDGKLRPCQDYPYLNEWMIKNAYPLPLISELMDKIHRAKYFTKLNICWGYNNIRIKDGDQWKAAFKTNRGLFEPTMMFFGICNSPAIYDGCNLQRLD